MSDYLTSVKCSFCWRVLCFFSGLTVIHQAFKRKVKLGNVRKRKKQVEVNFSWVCLSRKGIIHGELSDPFQVSNSLIRTQSFLGTLPLRFAWKRHEMNLQIEVLLVILTQQLKLCNFFCCLWLPKHPSSAHMWNCSSTASFMERERWRKSVSSISGVYCLSSIHAGRRGW